ncbi:MAG TPA: maleylpyruvate isomerase family mycothiol-dependent enzyme [Acidimicrobiales bacterium]|nr:maleylpyruvate isomerase family mycothiol-dependent enzyme [Acidimicrobiales bacterium]
MSVGGPEWAEAVATRSDEVVSVLAGLTVAELSAPSALPGWSRLTIACHLSYGADALCRMTRDALSGRAVAYYPGGRAVERTASLLPRPGESPTDVVASLGVRCGELTALWSALTPAEWDTVVTEPADNPDLGPLPLHRLALLRLGEVQVHGEDLALGLRDWSDVFVDSALTFRLEWLNDRRANHVAFDGDVQGSWLLVARDGPRYVVTVRGPEVVSRPAAGGEEAAAVIAGSSRDLLALLLGRPALGGLTYDGDVALGRAFSEAFPGP